MSPIKKKDVNKNSNTVKSYGSYGSGSTTLLTTAGTPEIAGTSATAEMPEITGTPATSTTQLKM
jgi:hypothetical protein